MLNGWNQGHDQDEAQSPGHSRDRYFDTEGDFVKVEDLHAIGRMNGLGNYVRTRDAFISIPRLSYKDWKGGKG